MGSSQVSCLESVDSISPTYPRLPHMVGLSEACATSPQDEEEGYEVEEE